MALVQYGGGILDARGSVGGQVHSRNRFGNFIRARTTPVNPNSTRQAAIRTIFAGNVNKWHTVLTQAQRDAWEVYAAAIVMTNKLGEQIKLTGFNHFSRSNTVIRQVNNNRVLDGPVVQTLAPEDDEFAVAVSTATQLISVTIDEDLDWIDQDDGFMAIYMSMPQVGGSKYIKGPWRYAGVVNGDSTTPPTSPQTITCPFVVGTGQRVGVYGRICEEDGRMSGKFRDDCLVAV